MKFVTSAGVELPAFKRDGEVFISARSFGEWPLRREYNGGWTLEVDGSNFRGWIEGDEKPDLKFKTQHGFVYPVVVDRGQAFAVTERWGNLWIARYGMRSHGISINCRWVFGRFVVKAGSRKL